MTDFYCDILLKPDAELTDTRLMNMVYTKLHKQLFDMAASDIGVSFPNYRLKLGNKLRIHSSEIRLIELNASDWLGALASSYCQIGDIEKVPDDVSHRIISRKNPVKSMSKLRRSKKRGIITTSDQEKAYKASMFSQGLDNPYLELESGSNKHKHRRFISLGELKPKPELGKFDSFGLSKMATIPWF